MAKVVVYTTENCGYCVAAKKLLQARTITFNEVLILESDDAAWEALVKKSGMRTFPQIFSGDELIGGFTELDALDKKDKLKSLAV
jgi:glutaredoxin 3